MTIYQVKVDNAYLNPEYTDEVGFYTTYKKAFKALQEYLAIWGDKITKLQENHCLS